MSMMDWLLELWDAALRVIFHPLVFCALVAVLLLALVEWNSRSIDGECARMMTFARASRDSLDVRMACNRLHSDAATATAIGIGAGIVAGSSAARGR